MEAKEKKNAINQDSLNFEKYLINIGYYNHKIIELNRAYFVNNTKKIKYYKQTETPEFIILFKMLRKNYQKKLKKMNDYSDFPF